MHVPGSPVLASRLAQMTRDFDTVTKAQASLCILELK